MATTISVPTSANLGGWSPEVATQMVADGSYDARMANAIIDLATAASNDINAIHSGASFAGTEHTVRGVVQVNVADLGAFTVATHDGLTFVEGNRVLLAAQTTGAQSGIYVVGAVDSGAAPLTRAADWAAAAVLPAGSTVKVNDGTAFKHSVWFASVAGAITVGTTAPAFYPRQQKGTTSALSGTPGTANVANVWLLSTTTSNIQLTANTLGGTAGSLSAPVAKRTAGIPGTGEFDIDSSANETSTVDWIVFN